jgi:hypothetical protein
MSRCENCPCYWQDVDETRPTCHYESSSLSPLVPAPCDQDDGRDDWGEHEEMLREWRDEAIAETALEILRHYSISYDLAREYATDAYDEGIDIRDILRSIRDELRPERLG